MDDEPILEIDEDGDKEWRLNGNLHRVDGPAVEFANGDKEWYLNGVFHRIDGPAIEYVNGGKGWWLNDKHYAFDEWLEVNNYISEEEKVMLKLIYG
jgi:hypothetical protein